MAESRKVSSVEIVSAASAGRPVPIERMPRATVRAQVAMRDGITLDTSVWLPADREGPFPAILFRTPYKETVTGWARLDTLRYRNAGYAIVFQVIRGVGNSGGHFSFVDPRNRDDGYDAIEWIAAQPWCDGAVGMDGSSYVGITQLLAAVAQPPSLRCIVPAVVSVDYFRDVPRFGGILSRQHTLGWTQFTDVDDLSAITPGLWGDKAFLATPQAWDQLLSRPAIDAADGVLTEDRLQHYRDVLTHETFDDWWQARTLSPEDYAKITVPTMVVTGLFDGSMGSQRLWRNLERFAPADCERWLLVGPWDHGQAYVGGGRQYGPYSFGEAADFDLFGTRLAFFDRHLCGRDVAPPLADRTLCYVTGANRWVGAAAYPHPDLVTTPLYLASDGIANLRGHGTLTDEPCATGASSDSFTSDPALPLIPVAATLSSAHQLSVDELVRSQDVLTYTSAPLARPLTLHGEFSVELFLAADSPDCDVICRLAEVASDGRARQLSIGTLRLRYREGFDRIAMLTPGEPVAVTIEMNHVGHELPAGARLMLLIGADLFPLLDPNPNNGEPIATARSVRIARETIFHDEAHPSRVVLPVLGEPPRWAGQPGGERRSALG